MKYKREHQDRIELNIFSNSTYKGIVENDFRNLNILVGNNYKIKDSYESYYNDLHDIKLEDLFICYVLLKKLCFYNLEINKTWFSRKVHIHNCNFNNIVLKDISSRIPDSSGAHIGIRRKTLLIKDCSLSDLKLYSSKLENLFIFNTNISSARIEKSTVILLSTMFKLNLIDSRIKNSEFKDVRFNKCKLNNINFYKVKLENVIFEDCDISNCKFELAKFEEVKFKYSRIKNVDFIQTNLRMEYFVNLSPPLKDNIYFYGNQYDYKELAETYLKIKNYLRDTGRYDDMSIAYLKEKESIRKFYANEIKNLKINNKYYFIYKYNKNINKFDKIKLGMEYIAKLVWEYFKFILFGYGEKPQYIFGWSLLIILIFSFIYFKCNLLHSVYQINDKINYLNSLYFSAVTFTTVGFGDFIPLNATSKIITIIEAFLGLFSYSLFVFSFGRRFAGR